MNNQKKKVLIVEDHPVYREGLKVILKQNPKLSVADECDNGKKALSIIKATKIDLVLVDISLAGNMNGIQLTDAIHKTFSRLPIIILSVHSKMDYVAQALSCGAICYVNKESSPYVLHDAINRALKRERFIDHCVSPEIVLQLKEWAKTRDGQIIDDSYSSLTKKEQEVMRLLANGLSASLVAKELKISPKTVDNHRTQIYRKLNLKNISDLLRYSIKIGLIDVETW